MKNTLISIVFLTIISCNTFAQSSHKTVVELMQKSGITSMFQQFEEIITAKVNEKKSTFEKEEDFNKFLNIMKSELSSINAEKYFIEYFELNTDEDSLKSIIKIYGNQFMQDMNSIELAASAPAKQQEQLIFFQGLKDNPPSQERIQQLVTLNNELGTSEMTVKILKNVMKSMAIGINEIVQKKEQIPQNELEEKLESSLPADFSQQMANQIIALSLFTYKDVSNDDFNKYLSIWQTPIGKYFSENTLIALDYSFSKMGKGIGKSMKIFEK